MANVRPTAAAALDVLLANVHRRSVGWVEGCSGCCASFSGDAAEVAEDGPVLLVRLILLHDVVGGEIVVSFGAVMFVLVSL